MKFPIFAIALLFAASAFAESLLPVEKAVSIASKHLKTRGNASAYITSVKLEPDNLQRSSFRWNVTWNEPITLDELKKEVGVVIAMDGSLVSLVKGTPNKDPMTGKYDPNGPTGLQNPRTRTDRPSILDLKR
jgi:hypothetical protein